MEVSTSPGRSATGPVSPAVDHSACAGQARRLTDGELAIAMAELPGWSLREDRLVRVFRFDTFAESISFVSRVAEVSESLNHHPNLSVADKRVVTLEIWTHKLDCLTPLDVTLAAQVGALVDARGASSAGGAR